MLTVLKKTKFQNLNSETTYFKTINELDQLLALNINPFKNATLIHECTGGNGISYEFHTDNFKFKYWMNNIEENGFSFSEEDDFDYFCTHHLEFTRMIFEYLSHPRFIFDSLFLLTNDEDDHKHVFDKIFCHLNFNHYPNHNPNIFIAFRDDPLTFDATKMLPNVLQNLYINPVQIENIWVLWNTNIYLSEEDENFMEKYHNNQKLFKKVSENIQIINDYYEINPDNTIFAQLHENNIDIVIL